MTDLDFPDLQRAIALSLDSTGKAPMPLRDLEMKALEKETQVICHLSREEAERNNMGKEGPRNCREKETSGLPSS